MHFSSMHIQNMIFEFSNAIIRCGNKHLEKNDTTLKYQLFQDTKTHKGSIVIYITVELLKTPFILHGEHHFGNWLITVFGGP